MNINDLNNFFKKLNVNNENSNKFYPTFIVGSPRSGSTFLHQYIASTFDIEYVTNYIAKFWGNPTIGYILQSEMLNNQKENFVSSFKSNLGYSDTSLLEPHEFGYFWNRWFNNTYSHYSSIDENINSKLQNEIFALLNTSNTNWVFKNMTLSLKIPLIKKLFPNCKFIYIKRDLLSNALSIYNARIQMYNSVESWWSLIPKEIEKIQKLPPEEQVVAQVYYINKQIEEDLHKLSSDDYLQIDYDLFKTNVKGYTTQLKQLLGAEIKNYIDIPFKKNTKENQYSDLLKPFVKKYKLLKDNQWS